MSNAVDESTRKKFERGPLPRGGNASTVGVTSNNNNQNHGASFRMVADTQDWDKTMFTNTPGQSGNPDSPFYGNLFEGWAHDRHFPVFFTREKVVNAAYGKIILAP
jgi:penicillin amidase